MIDIVKKTLEILPESEIKKAPSIILLMLGMGIFEVLGVASVMPFMTVLSKPELIETNAAFSAIYAFFGFESKTSFLMMIGFGVFVTLIVSNAFSAYGTYRVLQFAYTQNHKIAMRLLKMYLGMPYSYFLNQNSSKIGKTILDEVNRFSGLLLIPLFRVVSKSIVVCLMTVFLIWANPELTFYVAFSLIGIYLVVFVVVKKKVNSLGERRLAANTGRFAIIANIFTGIKEVKLFGKESHFTAEFSKKSATNADVQAKAQIISQLPKFFLEAVAFGGVVLTLIYLLSETGNIQDSLPIVAVFTAAGYRLMPALQQIFSGVNGVKFNKPCLETLHKEIYSKVDLAKEHIDSPIVETSLKSEIAITNLSFTYPGCELPVIESLDLEIKAGMVLGLVGASGSGKTTTLDLLLGLFEPSHGEVKVDGHSVHESENSLKNWQGSIGYIPQSIFLTDATIAENIAFGVSKEKIDFKVIEEVVKIAQLNDFVADQSKGVEAIVGDRGVKISGGQRQRIGIARALYRNPSVLFLDEATSALDNVTERNVINAIVKGYGSSKTIVIVTHRLSTIKTADKIVFFDKGKIEDIGKFENLVANNLKFRDFSRSLEM